MKICFFASRNSPIFKKDEEGHLQQVFCQVDIPPLCAFLVQSISKIIIYR